MNIIWKRSDGGVSVTHLTDSNADPNDEVLKLVANGDVPADWVAVGLDVTVPATREWRNAWEWDKTAITVNKDKAVEITKDRLRIEREPLLQALDTEFMKALETGADTTAIVAEKQRLRDITLQADVTKTLDELKAIKVESIVVDVKVIK